jgi:hypothetical protein
MHLSKRLERGVERGDFYLTKQNKQNIEMFLKNKRPSLIVGLHNST